ncbi:hypothetical protein [Funiculus sociatus]|uniref:hypothetical protein n=1 Tax=Funiculus sociatus TaxID=450527 RepID=UPI00329A5389
MIPVRQQPEPTDFESRVRAKGVAFLQKASRPQAWENREYWRDSLKDLYRAYDEVCAYSAQWIPRIEGSPTVDHFIPKSVRPELAYEWSNFRLSCLKMNARKRDFQDVLDPFQIQPDWFILDFPSLIIKANPELEESIKSQVKSTIKRLKLNDDDDCVKHRQDWLMCYCKKQFPFDFLKKTAPFIAYELERQKLIEVISSIMSVS